MSRATGVLDSKDDLMSKLSRIVQLTGFSDQVYAEAVVNVHQYDVLLGKSKGERIKRVSEEIGNLTHISRVL